VEIFPEQKDFAVRTFGMPGNPGFLGVCFGRLITANSPASQGDSPENWQAVLWHEFCHVITLQLTRNRMPRWLSEGISVYEERLADPAWGQHLHSEYRQMILGEDFVPISELSAAFLSPKSHQHVQFAYYESSLVVEFLVERFGFESLKAILRDLGEGKSIDAAISAHTAPMPTVESDFAAFARTKAEQLGPDLDWAEPPSRKAARAAAAEQEGGRRRVVPFGLGLPEEDAAWEATHPNNFFVLLKQAKQRLAEKQWAAAKTPLRKLLEAYPRPTGPDNLYLMLAAAHRGLGETEAEREALTKAAELAADAAGVYARLMELESARANWPAVKLNAERFLAVNPLLPEPYRFLAQAAEALADRPTAIDAYRRLLLLDPPDPAQTHFQLARLLHAAADPEAKRHVLMALEEAPRFRDAHRLLLQIAEDRPSSSAVSPDQASASGAASEAAVPPAGSQPVLP
jgi:tetratricopeptide (TPR) repeat protein